MLRWTYPENEAAEVTLCRSATLKRREDRKRKREEQEAADKAAAAEKVAAETKPADAKADTEPEVDEGGHGPAKRIKTEVSCCSSSEYAECTCFTTDSGSLIRNMEVLAYIVACCN